MPPRLRCPNTLSSIPSASSACKAGQAIRCFSTTPQLEYRPRVTRNRRAFFIWLNTLGQNFKAPREGSTNYLNAYTADGSLKREVEHRERLEKAEEEKKSRGGRERRGAPDEPVDSERSTRNKAKDDKLPPESNRDLQPFPLNNAFRSQSVLSDKLKQQIWAKIMEEGKSVRDVSVELAVDMRRVGAVVRLLEIENEWKRIVS
jgi:hypothetical protein